MSETNRALTGRRDPRRLFSATDRVVIRLNQDGLCAVCGERLEDEFHMHHRCRWADGGPTLLANGAAVCGKCHPSAVNVDWPDVEPRDWQRRALAQVLPRLRAGRMATVNAAPGAGKTLFTAFVVAELLASQSVSRVVIFVPNDNLRVQWMRALAGAGIFVDPKAWEGAENPDDFVGSVVTYQKLNENVVQVLDRRAARTDTLYVFDEVHHVADRGAWGKQVERLVGTFESPRRAALNLTGTLFRSAGREELTTDGRRLIVSQERIATVDYRPDPDKPDKLIAQADHTITSAELIADKHLRHVSLYEFDFDQGLQVIDLAGETVTSGGIIDLKEHPQWVRSQALRRVLSDEFYLRPKLQALLGKLDEQRALLNGHPVKGLVVCEDQRHAEQIHRMLGEMMDARPLIAISDDSRSQQAIGMFRELKRSTVLVNVRMVTEGFDCPDVTTIAHLTSWSARLFINQMVARAMRITDQERQLGRILPAAVLIPQDEKIRRAYAEVLVGTMHVHELPTLCVRCGQEPCICRYLCPLCGQLPCICQKPPPPPPPGPQFAFEVTAAAELVGVAHDGDDVTSTHDALREHLELAGVPVPYWPAVSHAIQKAEEERGFRTPFVAGPAGGPETRRATPREVADGLMRHLDQAARWMEGHGQPARNFNADCNRAAGIPPKGRPAASVAQLQTAVACGDDLIRRFCASSITPLPTWIGATR